MAAAGCRRGAAALQAPAEPSSPPAAQKAHHERLTPLLPAHLPRTTATRRDFTGCRTLPVNRVRLCKMGEHIALIFYETQAEDIV